MVKILDYSKFAPFKLFIFPFIFQWLLLSQVINFYFSFLNVSGIEMISKTSIYPCYSQFLILFTELREYEDEKRFIRLVRVFTTDSKENENNLRKLSYMREYKLPYNHVLQLNCSSDFPLFPPSTIKYYCFQFVAKDKVTRIIYDKIHRPKCRPSLLLNSEPQRTFQIPNQVINQNIQTEVNKVEYLQNREYSKQKNENRYIWTRRREAKIVNINCECVPKAEEEETNGENAIVPKSVMYDPEYPAILLHVTFPSCPVAISSKSSDTSHFGQGSNICVLTFVRDTNEERERNRRKRNKENVRWKKGNAVTSFDLQLLSVEENGSQSNVKEERNVAESYPGLSEEHQMQKNSVEKEEKSEEKSPTVSTRDSLLTINQLKFRDGSSKIDPLILVSDYSIINQVTSGKLRIERTTRGSLQHSGLEVKMRLTGKDHTNEQEKEKKERFMARNQVHEQSSPLLRYFMYGFGGFLVLASISFLLTCLTSRIRPHTVTIISRQRREDGKFEQEGDEEEQKHLTSDSHPPHFSSADGEGVEVGKCSLSQFDLEPDSNSLEMDYYDYHQGNLSTKNLTIGKKVETETCNKILSSLDRSDEDRRRKLEDEDSIQNIDSD